MQTDSLKNFEVVYFCGATCRVAVQWRALKLLRFIVKDGNKSSKLLISSRLCVKGISQSSLEDTFIFVEKIWELRQALAELSHSISL